MTAAQQVEARLTARLRQKYGPGPWGQAMINSVNAEFFAELLTALQRNGALPAEEVAQLLATPRGT